MEYDGRTAVPHTEDVTSHQRRGSRSRIRSRTSTTRAVTYSYSVDGTEFTGHRHHLTWLTATVNLPFGWTQGRHSNIDGPTEVDVYFDPGDPGSSSLSVSLPPQSWLLLFSAAMMLLAGPALASLGVRIARDT